MTTVTISQVSAKINSQDDRFSGEFDAAIALLPKETTGEYWRGYLAKINETGNTPF